MIVLGIDTATPGMGCALEGPTGTLASFAAEGRRHTELLAPAIEGLCGTAGLKLDEVDAIAIDTGPGLFTGLRVGLATAAALASALGRPALGLNSTDVLAEPFHRPGRQVVAVVDVRRGEVAWARYAEGGGPPLAPPALADAETLGQILVELMREGTTLLVVGDGAVRYQDRLAEVAAAAGLAPAGALGGHLDIDQTAPYPSAVVLAGLARRRLLAGTVSHDIAPLYLRQADVRIGWASHQLPTGATTHAAPIRPTAEAGIRPAAEAGIRPTAEAGVRPAIPAGDRRS